MRTTITIARQLGCGGSEVGQAIADRLGIRCIDREIVSQTAKQFHLDENEVANREEKVSSFWERVLGGMVVVAPEASFVPPPAITPTDLEIFESETKVMKSITAAENCVVVGRAAGHVLPLHPGMVNIYLHAPISFRLPRVMDYYGVDENKARDIIGKSDDMREKFIAHMTDCEATDARRYHLCLDSSTLPFPEIIDLIIEFVQRKVALDHTF
ncbi:cytidylate kinase-like family protein [bacterium]|nr:MAG: cytidylate kinase-like family protein [bacterium]